MHVIVCCNQISSISLPITWYSAITTNTFSLVVIYSFIALMAVVFIPNGKTLNCLMMAKHTHTLSSLLSLYTRCLILGLML